MRAQIKIEKIAENGSTIRITADCDNAAEIEEVVKTLREYTPRNKSFFGMF